MWKRKKGVKVTRGRGVRICEGMRGLTLSATSCTGTTSSLRNNEKPLVRWPIFKVFRTDDRPQQPTSRTFTREVGDYTRASAPFSLRTIVPNDSYLFYYEVDHSVYRWISDNGYRSRNDIISDQFFFSSPVFFQLKELKKEEENMSAIRALRLALRGTYLGGPEFKSEFTRKLIYDVISNFSTPHDQPNSRKYFYDMNSTNSDGSGTSCSFLILHDSVSHTLNYTRSTSPEIVLETVEAPLVQGEIYVVCFLVSSERVAPPM